MAERAIQQYLPVTARHVMEDIAAWWVRALLHDSNVNRLQDVMETILPGIVPLSSQSALAAQLKLLSLWQEVLYNTHLQGDFALLQDKFLLLAKEYGKSPASDHCMQLLKVHDVLGAFYESFKAGRLATEELRQSLLSLYHEKDVPTDLQVLMQPGEDIPSLQAHVESIVASNRHCGPTDLSYDALRDQMQAVLLQWIEAGFETPLLVKLGYHISTEVAPSTASASTATLISAPIVRREGRVAPETVRTPRQTPPPPRILRRSAGLRNIMRPTQRQENQPDQVNPVTLAHQSSTMMSARLASEPQTSMALFQLTERQSPGMAADSVDSESTAEARNTAPTEIDVEESMEVSETEGRKENTERQSPSTSTRRRRRSKYQKDPVAAPSKGEPDAEQHEATPSKKTIHNSFSFDDDEDSIREAQHRHKRQHLNPLSPLPSLPTPENKKKRPRPSAAEENLSPNYPGDRPPQGQRRRITTTQGPTTGTSPKFRPRQWNSIQGHRSTGALSSVGLPRDGAPRAPTLDRIRIAALALAQNTKRRPFNEKDDTAIKEGVSMYGNDWVAIKTHFVQTLQDRTLLHIKDRARTLVKKGKLDPALLV